MMSTTSVTTLGIGVGDVIAEKYRIESVLGAGGMGVVFSARHTTLNGQFALKFLSRDGLQSSQAIGRFYREAQAAARLRSEHAVRVFDVGTHTNGLPFIVMEYLEGADLGRVLRASGQLPVTEAVDYTLQTCAAIADAHKAGIIHRDLKPSNLFCVTREDKSVIVKVLDFGISKVTST
ncbi:MAG TPA: serine/threonine-protein kinase, partial [Polyangiaceae bacterium]|nr:serine/threonine-protein kinase [Polyangiaceae bacterium]